MLSVSEKIQSTVGQIILATDQINRIITLATPISTSVSNGLVYVCMQWRKPGPQFGGTKKNFAVPQIQKFGGGGTARNSLFLGTKQLNIE